MFRSVLEDIKMQIRGGSALSRLLIANVAVFVLLNILYRLVLLIAGYREPELSFHYKNTEVWLGFPYDPWLMITRPWTLVTSLFVHSGFSHIFWNMLNLYWFGRIFSEFTKKKLGLLYFTGGIFSLGIAYLSYVLFPGLYPNVSLIYGIGASGAVLAIIAAAATLVPNYSMNLIFIGPVKIIYIALVMILLDLLGVTYMDNTGGHFAHLGGALFGFLFVMGLKQGFRFPTGRTSGMKVVHSRLKKTSLSRKDAQKRIDEILDKINKSGYDSLSKEEKEDWFKLSNKV